MWTELGSRKKEVWSGTHFQSPDPPPLSSATRTAQDSMSQHMKSSPDSRDSPCVHDNACRLTHFSVTWQSPAVLLWLFPLLPRQAAPHRILCNDSFTLAFAILSCSMRHVSTHYFFFLYIPLSSPTKTPRKICDLTGKFFSTSYGITTSP